MTETEREREREQGVKACQRPDSKRSGEEDALSL